MVSLPENFTTTRKPQLFDSLSEENLQTLLAHSVLRDHDAHQILVQQGDAPEGVILIIEGRLKTFRLNEEGNEATIRMLEPGDTCMEAVLFMGGPSPISVQTLTKSKTLLIPDQIVKSQVLSDPRFAVNILRIVTRHYKGAMLQIDAMNTKSPLQRVGYYFLTQHLESGHDNLEFILPFQKQTIANYLGMTPETFSRTLKQMRRMGIEVAEDHITMRDSFALCHFCDSDTEALCAHDNHENCKNCGFHQVHRSGKKG